MRRRVSSGAELERVQRHLDELLGLLAAPPQALDPGFAPAVDLRDCGARYVVLVDVPGVSGSEISVDVAGRELRVTGRKLPEREAEGSAHCLHMERGFGTFSVEILLPGPVQPAAGHAVLRAGVLEITLPRLAERRDRAHAIPVSVEEP